jgi:hypothetical protein
MMGVKPDAAVAVLLSKLHEFVKYWKHNIVKKF